MTDETLLTETTEIHTAHNTVTREEPQAGLLSSVLAIIGFIILIIIVLWGLLHIATLASPWLSSLFNNKNAASIQVTAPLNVTSGENFTVSWKYSTSEKGVYAFLYQCKNNFHLETSFPNGTMNTIPCGTAFPVSSAAKNTIVRPMLSGTATTSVPISIIFMPRPATGGASATTSKQAQGSATVVVHPSTIVMTPPAPVTPAIIVKSHVSTPADLSVRIISLAIDPSGMGVVEFDIANVGGSSSGVYYFNAYLPTSASAQGYGGTTQSAFTYSSPAQSPLGPGDHVVSTLRFSQAVIGVVSIVVDPSNIVHESNKNNNYASQSVAMPYNAQPYQYQGGQYPYQY